jgi:hypothetical protein
VTKQGRPRVAQATEDLVLKMTQENPYAVSWIFENLNRPEDGALAAQIMQLLSEMKAPTVEVLFNNKMSKKWPSARLAELHRGYAPVGDGSYIPLGHTTAGITDTTEFSNTYHKELHQAFSDSFYTVTAYSGAAYTWRFNLGAFKTRIATINASYFRNDPNSRKNILSEQQAIWSDIFNTISQGLGSIVDP